MECLIQRQNKQNQIPRHTQTQAQVLIHTENSKRVYLVGTVEKCEDVAFLHGDLTRRFLCVVIQSHHLLRANVVNHWRFLLLNT